MLFQSLIDAITRLVNVVTAHLVSGGLSNKVIAVCATANVLMAIMLWITTRSSTKTARQMLERTFRVDIDVTLESIVPTAFKLKNIGTLPVELIEQNARPFVHDEWLEWGTYDLEGITLPVGGDAILPRSYNTADLLAQTAAMRMEYLFDIEVVYKDMKGKYGCHFSRYRFDHASGLFMLAASHTQTF